MKDLTVTSPRTDVTTHSGECWYAKRSMLDVLRDRNRFLNLLAAIETSPGLAMYRVEELYGMSRSLARKANDSYHGLMRAGDHCAATTLFDLIRTDFRRVTAALADLPEDVVDLLSQMGMSTQSVRQGSGAARTALIR